MQSVNLLSLVVFLPLGGAVLSAFLPSDEPGQHRALALAIALATFLLSLGLWFGFSTAASAPEFQFELRRPWVTSFGVSYHVGIDGVALLLIMLTTALTPIALLASWRAVEKRVKEFMIAVLVLETAMLGTFAALDLVLFYVFWEAVLIPMYLLIGIWGSDRRIYATLKFFIYTFVASVLMLVALLYAAAHAGGSFDYVQVRQGLQVSATAQRWLFLAFAAAFAVKVPMFPLHTWLPDAHTEAPTAGSIFLAGVLLKMGTFGFFRYALPLFPEAALHYRPLLATLAVVGILYGALMCLAQEDMKRLVAYSSVSHMGFVMLGLMALTAEGVTGSVYQMVNHGVSTGALFLLVGLLYERRHTRRISEYGGVAAQAPWLASGFVLVTLSSIGLPGTNGFIGEFLVLSGTWISRLMGQAFGHPVGAPWFAAASALGVVLGAVYMLLLVERLFFGPLREASLSPEGAIGGGARAPVRDLSSREWAALLPLLLLIVGMGVVPQPFLEPARRPVEALLKRFTDTEQLLRSRDPNFRPATGTGAPAIAAGLAAPAPAPAEGE